MASFPRPPLPAFLEHDTDALDDYVLAPPKIARGCKHGVLDCEVCGMTERDALHTTRGGQGVVARLRNRS